MKIHSENATNSHRINAYGDDFVAVDSQIFRTSLVVMPDRLVPDWLTADASMPDDRSMHALTELGAEIVLYGTGRHQRFPSAETFALFTAAGVGFEVMDTPAACRTYNILAGEGRRVAAALIVGAG